MTKTCTIDGCDRTLGPKDARGWCNKHYSRWRVHGDPNHKPYKVPPAERRFRQKFTPGGPDDCWEWQGSRHPVGHGTFNAGVNDGGYTSAHRFAWQLANGPIPDGQVVRHRCDNPPCVNPDHLELGTQADNVRDMVERGRDSWTVGNRKRRTGCTVDGCDGAHASLGLCKLHYDRNWRANRST